jgi:predicted amidohydrolase YtcJ
MLLLSNAKIQGRASEPASEAIALEDGRILGIGSAADLRSRSRSDVTEIDVGGRRVIPGLIDSHAHVLRAGLTWDREIRWEGVPSLEAALEAVRGRARALGFGAWVPVIGGWHEGQFSEGRRPTRDDLDRVVPDNPCYVQRLYTEAVLNSAALAACGFVRGAADPPGGELERDAEGNPTGVVRGLGAFLHCVEAMGPQTLDEQAHSICSMLRDLSAYGLTGAIDPGGVRVTPETYEPLYEVWRRGDLTLRIRLYLGAGQRGNERREIEDWMRFMPRGFGDDLLRITGIGEIIVFGCWDRDGIVPFQMDPESLAEFTEISRLAAERGWPMHVHAVRDSSTGAILDAWEAVAERRPIAPLRFSIAHAEQIGERNLARARALGVGLALQNRLIFRAADSARAWGEEAVSGAPPLRRMLELGFPLGAGTDSTVANSINPWRSLWWFVTGKSLDGGPQRAEEHRLTRSEALDLYTRGSTWFSFEEQSRGQLAPGYLADLAVLSDDYFAVPEDAIPEIRSELTVVGGRIVHASEAFSGATEARASEPGSP